MSSFRIRPRFKHSVKAEKEELEKSIDAALENDELFVYRHIPGHICIKIHPVKRHVWSPQLDLSFEQEGESVIVRGMYGPNPTLWVVFFFGYVLLGFASLFIAIWGFSVWSIGGETTVLWILPVLGIAALVLYLISQTGQKLGAQQMFDIHHFYETVTSDKIIVS